MDFDAFYRDTSRRLLRYAYGLTGDPAEAQDLVQEAYAGRGLRSTGTVKSWLSRGRAGLAAALGPIEPALLPEGTRVSRCGCGSRTAGRPRWARYRTGRNRA
jgi:hypothetical protein